MYRVLIVDNEPIIADGIYDLLLEVQHVELAILKAYSAAEALHCLSAHKIDIVFADIHMPGMNGLELQQTIKERWPRCKVIFLTGLTDFTYVQTAIRNGGSDYVLKTEGDDRILEALDKSIQDIQESLDKDNLIDEARQMMHLAKPTLQKEFVISLLDGDRSYKDTIQQSFEELGIPLRTDLPLLLIMGRIDEWPEYYTASDRMLMIFAIHNIAQEYLAKFSFLPLTYDRTKFVWFVQSGLMNPTEPEWFVNPVLETLDAIQSICSHLLKTTISIAAHRQCCDWHELPAEFNRLKRLLGRGLGLEREILLIEPPNEHPASARQTTEIDHHLRNHRNNVVLLESFLESGAYLEFSSLCHSMLQSAAQDHYAYNETYYRIATMLLSYLNRMGVAWNLLERPDLKELMRIEKHKTWEDAWRFFEELAKLYLEQRRQEKEESSNVIVNRLQQYVCEHLSDDLSLTRLSEVVHLNPSYLSRFYKQRTGHGLSEYICELRIEKAVSLLRQSPLKIHEIAREVGLEAGYFIKLFKKYVHMTPQEYRERMG